MRGWRLEKALWLAAGVAGALAIRRLRRRFSFAGRSVLVTGGSRGLGLLVARQLAGRGARLTLLARDAEELGLARRELEERGAEVLALPCDVADPAAVGRAVEEAEARFGAIEALVNCAGIIQVGPLEALSLADLREVMEVDFWGTVHATLAVLPGMRRRRAGRIVDVVSIGGAVAVPHLLGYSAAKFAAVGFSSGVAAEVARDGVVVTTVLPGLMRTGSHLHALVKGDRRRESALFAAASSLPGLTLDADRAARRIVLACERGEGFVTLGLPAKALRLAGAVAPGFTRAAMALASRLLPRAPPGAAREPASPVAAHHPAGTSVLSSLSDAAAARNNELSGLSGPGLDASGQ